MYQKLPHLTYVQGETVNELMVSAFEALSDHGQDVPSRNGSARSLYNTELTILNPRERHLNLEGRTSNPFQLIAETFWVVAGLGGVKGYLEFFLPRAPEYSDDGETWRGAYGPRIYEYGQMESVIERFAKDKMTRQAVVDIYQSEKDSNQSLMEEYGLKETKDTPCNDFIFFWIEPDNTFHMKTVQRSGDAIFGAGSINMFEFTFIHEAMFQHVKELYPEIKLGAYHHNTVNFHLYDFTAKQAKDVLDAETQRIYPSAFHTTTECQFPSGVETTRKFFNDLVSVYTKVILGNAKASSLPSSVDSIFKRYNLLKNGNLLYTYATLVATYVMSKLGETEQTYSYDADMSETLYEAVVNSKFTKFNVETR